MYLSYVPFFIDFVDLTCGGCSRRCFPFRNIRSYFLVELQFDMPVFKSLNIDQSLCVWLHVLEVSWHVFLYENNLFIVVSQFLPGFFSFFYGLYVCVWLNVLELSLQFFFINCFSVTESDIWYWWTVGTVAWSFSNYCWRTYGILCCYRESNDCKRCEEKASSPNEDSGRKILEFHFVGVALTCYLSQYI